MDKSRSDRTGNTQPSVFSFKGILLFLFGFVTGTAAGLIGVGGGEFRIPVLHRIFKNNPKTASAINLLIGLFTVLLSLTLRWSSHHWDTNDIIFIGILAITSIFGSIAGAKYVHKVPNLFIKKIIYAYLFIVGLWMLIEGIIQHDFYLWHPQGLWKFFSAAVIGMAIAFISAIFGVAGGELRIPALIYLFAIPIKEAGTISLTASIPTLAAGATTYRSLGYLPKNSLYIALVMGIGSLAGAILGSFFVQHIDKHLLKSILGVVLFFAALSLIKTDFAQKITYKSQ